MSADFELSRFRSAQDSGATYDRAVTELRAGRKATHWMWFVFPQLDGLGQSATAKAYAIRSLAEARAYLRDPILGARLLECASIVAGMPGVSVEHIFGALDAIKLRSSMTLFARAAPGTEIFAELLAVHFDGLLDPATEALLEKPET